ncbi:hypothetical protein [Kribbella sp. NPDC051137]|uniref:hypothetical protein n=1 Tax=Kribbella sp. NPDC051137 TaxID=3155045 RepID=UPI00343BDB74
MVADHREQVADRLGVLRWQTTCPAYDSSSSAVVITSPTSVSIHVSPPFPADNRICPASTSYRRKSSLNPCANQAGCAIVHSRSLAARVEPGRDGRPLF